MIGYLLLGRERRCSYSVHEPPSPAVDRVARAEALEFVKDGFEFPAFVLPPVWLASRGIWLGVFAYLGAAMLIFGIAGWVGLPSIWPALALAAIHLIIGTEADELHRSHLAAKGWSTVGHVTGTGALDCERRFYDQWLPAAPMTRMVPAPATSAAPSATSTTSVPITQTSPNASRGAIGGVLGNFLAPRKGDR